MRRICGLLGVLAALLIWTSTASASSWDQPTLTNPVTVDLSASAGSTYHDSYRFSSTQDVRFTCPTNPVYMPSWFEIIGGHNIVLEHCNLIERSGDGSPSRALKLQNNTGTVWVHDVHFGVDPSQYLFEGTDLDEPDSATGGGANVVFRDVRFDGLHGTTSSHADCIQSWRGPKRLLIDGFTCVTDYQGLFLLPNQYDQSSTPLAWDFRNVNLRKSNLTTVSFWLGNLTTETMIPTWNVQNVFSTNLRVWDGTGSYGPCGCGPAWSNAQDGLPPSGGDYVWATPDGAYGIDDPTPLAVLPGE